MKKFKKIIILGVIMLTIGVTSVTAFAALTYKTPAEAVAGLTGKTVESVIAERQETGKTYGTIAAEAGKLNEFKKENMEMKKENLKKQVEEKTMTQEKADTIIKAIEENQENCDGTGAARIGQREGARFGFNGAGKGNGCKGEGQGMGNAKHARGGRGFQDGRCNTLTK